MAKQGFKDTSNDLYVYQELTSGLSSAAMGIDNVDGIFKIQTLATPGAIPTGSVQLSIDSSVNGNITFAPNGTGSTIANNGDLTVAGGNLNMTNTNNTGTSGVICFGGSGVANRFLSNYGTDNIFLGAGSGNIPNTGASNVGMGSLVFSGLVGGIDNVGLGAFSSQFLTNGESNTALGYYSLNQLIDGNDNVAIGNSAGFLYTGSESDNILLNNVGTVGDNGVIRIGTNSVQTSAYIAGVKGVTVSNVNAVTINTTTGQLGSQAFPASASSFPTDSGTATPSAGVLNITSGLSTDASGATVKFTGSGNTVTFSNTDAALNNIFIGKSSGNTTLTGNQNITVGVSSLPALTSGSANTAMGSGAANRISTGIENVAFGVNALATGTASSRNSAFGVGACQTTSGSDNTALGWLAFANAGGAGNFNTAVGSTALLNMGGTGSRNIAIGYAAGSALTSTESNNIVIGSAGVVADSGTIRIGSTGNQTKAFIAGIDGVNVGSVAKVVTMASDKLGTATLTAGTNISITPSANTITIASTAVGLAWTVITANQTAAVSNGYFANKAGTLALALPATSAVGDIIEVSNINTLTGTQITQAAGQQVFIGNTNTTLGVGGSLTSTSLGDSLKLVCRIANTTYQVVSMIGNWTVV